MQADHAFDMLLASLFRILWGHFMNETGALNRASEANAGWLKHSLKFLDPERICATDDTETVIHVNKRTNPRRGHGSGIRNRRQAKVLNGNRMHRQRKAGVRCRVRRRSRRPGRFDLYGKSGSIDVMTQHGRKVRQMAVPHLW